MTDTILTMADGRGIDLNAVKASDISFPVLAEHVAKEARFNGATPGVVYSVAQHLVIGTDAILAAGGTEAEAAHFLVHDIPEGFYKDDPTPKKRTIAKRIAARCGVTAEAVLGVLKQLDDEHEAAVHQAAGLCWPIPEHIHLTVKSYDLKMFVTEWRDLMRGIEHPNWAPYANIEPLAETIEPWPWAFAMGAWFNRARKLLPAMRRAAA